MIERNIEIIIEDSIKHYPITLVTGPRQIGKSTLLYNSFLNKGYTYISLDDSLEYAMAKSDPKTFLELHRAPLIIDEAQKAPELFPELEKIVNESRLKKGNKERIWFHEKNTNDVHRKLPSYSSSGLQFGQCGL